MNQKHQILRCWVLLAFFTFPCCMTSHARTFGDRVDAKFRKWNRDNMPGCTIAVVKDGHVIYSQGYGMADLTFDIPNTTSTLFRFGSNSKQFAAFSIFLLEEEGKLSLDDPVSEYIEEFPDFGQLITLRHLIHHISGLRDYLELFAFSGWVMENRLTKDMALSMLSRQKALNFEPGDQFMYSNTGYMLLAEIVSRVSGKTFAEFTKERIFEPLGMPQTHFRDNHFAILKNFANSYGPTPTGETIHLHINFSSVGEGGLVSNVEELVKWDRNFYDPKVGSFAILEKMHRVGMLNNGTELDYAGALIIQDYKGKKIVYHGGDLAGYHGNLVRFPDEHFSIITMANTAELSSTVLLEKSIQIADLYFNNPPTSIPHFMIHEPSFRGWGMDGSPFYSPDMDTLRFLWDILPWQNKKEISFSAKKILPQVAVEEARPYIGRYYSDELDVFHDITYDAEKKNLLYQIPNFPIALTLKDTRRDLIRFEETEGITGRFFRNANKEVIGLKISNPRIVDLAFRKAEIVTAK